MMTFSQSVVAYKSQMPDAPKYIFELAELYRCQCYKNYCHLHTHTHTYTHMHMNSLMCAHTHTRTVVQYCDIKMERLKHILHCCLQGRNAFALLSVSLKGGGGGGGGGSVAFSML